ncbi:MAG: SusC/RagA family TonB-linked outer membrane protein [Bacteroides sp.]|nr:SusC/RagA family TonB-linked outer membrane protein [Bacteroides sp.]
MRRKILLLIVAVIAILPLQVFGRDYSVTFANTNVETALKTLRRVTGYDFVYQKDLIKDNSLKINGDFKDQSLETILEDVVSAQMGLSYKVMDKTIVLQEVPVAKSSKATVKGVVVDESGEPLAGASVLMSGSSEGVATDIDGNFTLTDVPTKGSFKVSYIGYQPLEVRIAGRRNFRVVLQPDLQKLEEVVVVGYGTTNVKDLTGSVASVGERTLGQLNVPNASQMLQNVAAGVQVSSGTGVPGETVRVRVRGATSLTGSNEPLFVIDGVPVEGSDALNNIPPSDIKSLDVLKDASAAAIYGSRAANGVVLVTTKSGEHDQKASVSFNYNVTTDHQINNFRILYGDEWRETIKRLALETQVFDPSNSYCKQILEENSRYLGDANTNWFNLVKQTAIRHNANLSVSGGGKNTKYLMSLSLMDQKGMVIGDRLKRYSAHMVSEASILPILRFGMNANATYSDSHSANTSLFSAQGTRPDLSPYNDDGSFDLSMSTNPVAELEKRNNNELFTITGTVYGEVDIIKGLRFRTSLSGTLGYTDSDYFNPSYITTRKEATGGESHYRRSKTLWDNTLNYNAKFGIHAIDAMAGVSWEKYISKTQSISGKTYPDDEIFTNIGSAATVSNWNSSYSSNGLFSSFARLNYRLYDRYLLTFTCRYDGSSMFGANNRYGFFPSGAIAWRINNESFMRDFTFVDDLKLRFSAGRTGVQNLGTYANRDIYKSGSYNGANTIYHSQVGNRDIRWEKSTQYDLGLDFAFLNSRLRGSLSGYWKYTDDLIWSFSFPPSATSGSMPRNIGSVRNAGIELTATGNIITGRDWDFDLTLNLSHNRNKVTKLVEEGRVQAALDAIVHGSGNQVLAQGYPMGAFFGWEHNGIIQSQERIDELNRYAEEKGQRYYDGNTLKPGNVEYVDLNGDGIINNDDRTIIGSPEPAVFGGLISNVRYKDFHLFLNFGYQIGGKKIYSKALQNVPGQLCGLIEYGLSDRWSDSNRDGKLPALYIGEGVPRMSDYQLFDASFFRLQEVRLTYTIPMGKYFRGNVFVAATNLFTITSYPGTDAATVNSGNYGGNYDTSAYPGIRSFSAGLQISL